MVAQDMLYVYCLLESLEHEVKLPMVLEMDNSGAVGIANSWSVGDIMHHIDALNYFLHKLNDQGLLVTKQMQEKRTLLLSSPQT
jgi:hypothetical protein